MALVSQVIFVLSLGLLLGLGSWLGWQKPPAFSVVSQHAAGPRVHHQLFSRVDLDLALTRHYEALVRRVLAWLPLEHVQAIRQITITYDSRLPRGLGGGDRIVINATATANDQEFVAVLIHEVGHIVDTGWLQGTLASGSSPFRDGQEEVYRDDRSLRFYAFSWQTETARLATANPLDFVSGYSQFDAFEDFAESYTYYRLHGLDFRALAVHNEVLRQKYLFLRDHVFAGQEYGTGGLEALEPTRRVYDATLLPLVGEAIALAAQ